VRAPYQARAAQHAADRDVELRRSVTISRLRLLTFLPGAALLFWMVTGGAPSIVLVPAILFLAAFAALVVWHSRVEERAQWFEALRLANSRAHARVTRDWNGLPAANPPDGIDLTHHPYALDLDLFGRASLAQWLGPSATPAGASSLASWLLDPSDPDDIRARQAAAAELAPLVEWREQLSAHGILASSARGADLDRFFEWAEERDLFGGAEAAWRALVIALTLSIWILLALQISGIVAGAFWTIPLIAGVVLSFVTARRLYRTFDRAGAGQRTLSRYAGLFEHAVAAPAESARLRELHDRMAADGHLAPQCMRQLNWILGFAELRSSAAILHFPVQALTLWDFHVAFALDRWRRRVGRRVRAWIAALGELDALASLATVSFDNPAWCTPEFGSEPQLTALSIGHPLLSDARRIANDVDIGPPGSVLVITGSNMSGKSTLLRAVGLNVVLAQAGAVACAASLRLPPCLLEASIRVQDSLELGLSYFMAALARLKGIVDAAERPHGDRVLLYLLDEILQGTNSAERSVAVRAIVQHLLDAGAIGAMTTHDLAVASQAPLDRAARLVHFAETVDASGTMTFDYRLRPGLATSRNALRLMQLIGLELPGGVDPPPASNLRFGPRRHS
jgi:ABC-type multidrug transport system fused ATPase/permease subunit